MNVLTSCIVSRLSLLSQQLAADRFINYWDKRRKLFGTDCFGLPMTIDGALRHDKVALEAGVITLLPKPDASGRPILYYLPHRHTRKDYDRDSMVCWFGMLSKSC